MPRGVRAGVALLAWVAGITAIHGAANLGWGPARERARLTVGYLPVTCHLTCPVTNWVTEHSRAGTLFASKRYTSFAAMVEDVTAGNLQAGFMLAPLAMVLAREGAKPVKIVHLGHRDGTALVVPRNSPVRSFADLRGARIAIPHRFSNQRILLERLREQFGLSAEAITLVDFPPPEMAAGLRAGQFDAFIVGEPHCAKAELEGIGRILYFTKDIWPNFISCVLVVTQELIDTQPDLVQELVTGINSSGQWLDGGPPGRLLDGVYLDTETPPAGEARTITIPAGFGTTPRMQAAQIAGLYYGQPPELLKFVLSRPPDRVRYTDLELHRQDFAEIQRYAERLGFFAKRPVTAADPLRFEDYCDDRFEKASPHPLAFRN